MISALANADLASNAVQAVLTGGPMAVVLAIAVVYLVRRDNARDTREREDKQALIQTVANNTHVMTELRKEVSDSHVVRQQMIDGFKAVEGRLARLEDKLK